MSKGLGSLRLLQTLHIAQRNTGSVAVENDLTETAPVNQQAASTIISEDAPKFEGILFQIPGRGGCDIKKKDRCKTNKKQGCVSDCANKSQFQGERKVQCPPPQRPTQPPHCMKIISYPPKIKDCPGPCPRMVKDNQCGANGGAGEDEC